MKIDELIIEKKLIQREEVDGRDFFRLLEIKLTREDNQGCFVVIHNETGISYYGIGSLNRGAFTIMAIAKSFVPRIFFFTTALRNLFRKRHANQVSVLHEEWKI